MCRAASLLAKDTEKGEQLQGLLAEAIEVLPSVPPALLFSGPPFLVVLPPLKLEAASGSVTVSVSAEIILQQSLAHRTIADQGGVSHLIQLSG